MFAMPAAAEVRSRLFAGGRWIRTSGSAQGRVFPNGPPAGRRFGRCAKRSIRIAPSFFIDEKNVPREDYNGRCQGAVLMRGVPIPCVLARGQGVKAISVDRYDALDDALRTAFATVSEPVLVEWQSTETRCGRRFTRMQTN